MVDQLTRITQLYSACNIVVAGETGVGKSSLINLIVGQPCCKASNDVRGVTTKTECHEWTSDGQTFHLWDTPGLSEGSAGAVSPKRAREALQLLLAELRKGGGVQLLMLCMRGVSKVLMGTKRIYDTIVRIRDEISPNIPLVAVVTELDKQPVLSDIITSLEDWWTAHLSELNEFQMMFSSYACITTLPDADDCCPKLRGRYSLCQDLVRKLIVRGVSPKRNIVIAGEAGAGKSSLVNLVFGVNHALVRGGLGSSTLPTAHYDGEINGQVFRLWDTTRLEEGLHASSGLRSLFMDPNVQGGVHLLIICIRGVTVMQSMPTMKRMYDDILNIRDKYCLATPVVAVITELESDSTTIASDPVHSMEQWWKTNSVTFSENGMLEFIDHVCITCLPDNCEPPVPGRREVCQAIVRKLITSRSLPMVTSKELNVLLFGQTGVGKSSLINLLAEQQIALVSSDSKPCTLSAEEYQFQLGRVMIRLWDTVGLEEPENRDKNKEENKDGYLGAIEKAVALVRQLSRAGGISLFLFCICGNRITQTTRSNYRLFYEVLGNKEVPIAFAVTHLEKEEKDMEDWWRRNVGHLKQLGIQSAPHACVTTLETHPRYASSRQAMKVLISSFDEQGKFLMRPEAWTGKLIKGLRLIAEKSFPGKKDLVKILMSRCSLDSNTAQWVAAYIDTGGYSVD